ncbi:MAG: zinc ABC transporter substrate-binding protein [Geminicoccaceae bacterium]|nr:zinc ABC transporter substrate-binding protein [Geminicoccaceae bacterium]MCB9968342.1 zinc ABC transporter substrate-binding protein [Geminicoccaceae bacterium]HRY24596.1 zinc ABC transporter substrate-binding protein [Geminicoccaceae bacterium]
MRGAAFLGTFLVAAAAVAQTPPRVVATILPVHGIAAAVMEGVGEPALLLEPGASPHSYSLRPSQAAMLEEADLVLWVGPGFEAFLTGPLETLGAGGHRLALAEVAGVERLGFREGAMFEDHAAAGHGHEEAHEHAHGGFDSHVWLSPANARVMAQAMAAELGQIDPANAERYAANAAAFGTALDTTEAEVEALVVPVRGRPFVVFHDAYHYFEHAFDIEAAGAIQVNPELQPGAARIAEIQERLGELEVACVFTEPQFEPRLVATLIEGTKARTGVLDPLGVALEPGPRAYHELLLGLARNLAECLAD